MRTLAREGFCVELGNHKKCFANVDNSPSLATFFISATLPTYSTFFLG